MGSRGFIYVVRVKIGYTGCIWQGIWLSKVKRFPEVTFVFHGAKWVPDGNFVFNGGKWVPNGNFGFQRQRWVPVAAIMFRDS